jgi:hypothetical protein
MSTLCSGKLKKKETHKLENEAIKVIEALEKQMHKRNTNYTTSIEEGNTKKIIEGIYHTHLNGIILRARHIMLNTMKTIQNTVQTFYNVDANTKLYTD